jgi:uncharacterized OB-fold protein
MLEKGVVDSMTLEQEWNKEFPKEPPLIQGAVKLSTD